MKNSVATNIDKLFLVSTSNLTALSTSEREAAEYSENFSNFAKICVTNRGLANFDFECCCENLRSVAQTAACSR